MHKICLNAQVFLHVRTIGFCLLFLLGTPLFGQTKRALLIGLSDYPQEDANSWSQIHGANDVNLLSATLKNQGFRIQTVTNKAASAKGIRAQLKKFANSCHPSDLVYIHFSCHGQPVEDLDGDETDGWDESVIPYDAKKVFQEGKYEGEKHILDDELNSYLRLIRSNIGPDGIVYVVIDACHAGSSYRNEEEDSVIIRGTNQGFSSTGKLFAPRIDKRGKIKVEKSPSLANICILEACRSYQVNSEIQENGTYYGPLSYYVNKVLQASVLSNDISWTEKVEKLMNKDVRLVRQNIVFETSF